MISFGNLVRNITNDMQGLVIGRAEYATGLVEYLIAFTPDASGNDRGSAWYPEQYLETLNSNSFETIRKGSYVVYDKRVVDGK